MLAYTQLTGTWDDGSGTPMSGTVTFTPSQAVYAAGIPVLTPATPVQAQITGGQLQSMSGGPVKLLATDNTGLSYAGLTGWFSWSVQITVGGQAQPSWSFFLPSSPSTVDLYRLASTAAGSGGSGFTSPMTALGDMISGGAAGAAVRLPGNPASTPQFLVSAGSGGVATAPVFRALQAGDLPAAAALLTGATFTGWIAPAVVALTFGTTISVNAALGNDFRVTLTASTGTLANPTNPVDGQDITFAIAQDATGGRTVAWGAAYDFGATGAPALSTAASKVDLVAFKYHGGLSKWLCLGSGLGY